MVRVPVVRLALALCAATSVVALFAAPAPASFFTLQDPVIIDASNNGGSGLRARIRPVTDTSGTFVVTDGVVDFAVQDVLLFDVRVLGSSTALIETVSASVTTASLGVDILGVGALSGSGVPPTTVTRDAVNFEGDFAFGPFNQLGPNDISSRLFLTYPDSGPLGNLAVGQVVNFTLGLFGGGTVGVSGVVAPEPGTFALLGGGMLALGALRRRQRA